MNCVVGERNQVAVLRCRARLGDYTIAACISLLLLALSGAGYGTAAWLVFAAVIDVFVASARRRSIAEPMMGISTTFAKPGHFVASIVTFNVAFVLPCGVAMTYLRFPLSGVLIAVVSLWALFWWVQRHHEVPWERLIRIESTTAYRPKQFRWFGVGLILFAMATVGVALALQMPSPAVGLEVDQYESVDIW